MAGIIIMFSSSHQNQGSIDHHLLHNFLIIISRRLYLQAILIFFDLSREKYLSQ